MAIKKKIFSTNIKEKNNKEKLVWLSTPCHWYWYSIPIQYTVPHTHMYVTFFIILLHYFVFATMCSHHRKQNNINNTSVFDISSKSFPLLMRQSTTTGKNSLSKVKVKEKNT